MAARLRKARLRAALVPISAPSRAARGVALVAGGRGVQAGLVAVEPRPLLPSERANWVKPGRPPIALQDQVRLRCCRSNRSRRRTPRRHATLERHAFSRSARIRAGRSARRRVPGRGARRPVSTRFERRGRRHELERAAHRKPFVGAALERCPSPVSRTKTPSRPPWRASDRGEPFVASLQPLLGERSGARARKRRNGRQAGKERTAAVTMMELPLNWLRRPASRLVSSSAA